MKIVKKILTAVLCAALATGIAAVFAGCGHAHVWSDEWESDSVGHSHECTECGEVATEEHTYSEGVCVVCGYECEHGEWESDKLNHWQTCTECGEQFSSEHNFVSGECTVCGYECVHEYAAEWACDTQTHWHECAICASVNGEKAHEYLLGKCTECGYVCVHGGIQWEITELNHYGTCAQCGTTLSGRHEYSDGICTVCGKPEPEVIEVDYLIGDADFVEVFLIYSSVWEGTSDSEVVSRVIAAFKNVQFTETSRAFNSILGDKFQATGQYEIYTVRYYKYVYPEDGDVADFEYVIDINVFTDGTGFIELKKDDGWHHYITDIGAVDYAVIDEVHDELMQQLWEKLK